MDETYYKYEPSEIGQPEEACGQPQTNLTNQLNALEDQTEKISFILTEIIGIFEYLDGSIKVEKNEPKDSGNIGVRDGFVNLFEYLNKTQRQQIDKIFNVLHLIKTKL